MSSATSGSVLDKLSSKSEVIQVYRYPGLSESALKTLLQKVSKHEEHCSNAFAAGKE